VRVLACAWLLALLIAPVTRAQTGGGQAAPPPAPVEEPKDALGRDTPRGTLLGFMRAAREGNDEAAVEYLNTTLRATARADLARQLYVVLDSRLPARLGDVSDRPEGGLANPLRPDEDVVGTIATADGELEIVVERVTRSDQEAVWLFARRTLAAIPDVHAEIDVLTIDPYLPEFLVRPRLAGVRLIAWVVLLLVVPTLYRLIGVLSGALGPAVALWRRRHGMPALPGPFRLPGFVRLFFIAVAIRWLVSVIEVPLFERLFWASVSVLLVIASVVWMLLRANVAAERYFHRRFDGSRFSEIASLAKLGRRAADVLVMLVAGLVVLSYFGVDPTAALAGLGIGGIAVALAAQKTLENVIGGLSLIFDRAVRVGDFLKFGDTYGSVDSIGLRSTRIRTLDRTILSVPNGQIANASVETLSARDMFWFHHFVPLRYGTTAAQLRAVIEGTRRLLLSRPEVDRESARVRFLRLGSYSLDIEIFAYVFAADWSAYLLIQEELLLSTMEIVEECGAAIALPSQTLHLAGRRLPVERTLGSLPATVRPAGVA
jgi:MscS family membrane protein